MTDDPLAAHPDDEIYRIAKVALSMVPGLGSPLVELFGGLIEDPAKRRRDEIVRTILSRLLSLEQRKLTTFDDLRGRPDFHATLVRGIQAGMREIETEKLKTIQDAVVNTALDADLEPAIRSMLFSTLERVTTAHIKLLLKVSMMAAESGYSRVSSNQVLADGLTEYEDPSQCTSPMRGIGHGSREFFFDERELALRKAILNNLIGEGLLLRSSEESPHFSQKPSEYVELTVLGASFLHFIRDPDCAPLDSDAPHGSN
jgi:hypothetical protein